ncbi:MAG: response regulator, partial [Bacteriovoracaceae bacterium]|nr:response regulator [Bacteriovoracaceae bacterium]
MKQPTKSTKEILVIDDDSDTQIFLKKILNGAGFSCSVAGDVESGSNAIQTQAPHLILLDYKLGQESGFEVKEFLRSK